MLPCCRAAQNINILSSCAPPKLKLKGGWRLLVKVIKFASRCCCCCCCGCCVLMISLEQCFMLCLINQAKIQMLSVCGIFPNYVIGATSYPTTYIPPSMENVCVYWCVVDKQTAAAAACAVSCHYVQRSLGRLTMFAFVQRDSSSFCFLRRRLHLRSIVMAIMQNPRLTQRDERRRGKR